MIRRVSQGPCPTRLVALALTAGSLAALGSCGSDRPLDEYDDAICERALNADGSIDALVWFKDPYGGPKRLGEWSTDQGLAFAHALEALGAKWIVVVGVRKIEGPEPFESAEGLVVALPEDAHRRRALFRLYAKQVRSEGYAPQTDTGQKYLFLPWEK